MAPEVIDSVEGYDISCDTYSYAMTMWFLFAGEEPFSPKMDKRFRTPWGVRDFVLSGERLPVPESTPKALTTLMQHCWDKIPSNRPKFDKIVEYTLKFYNALLKKMGKQQVESQVPVVSEAAVNMYQRKVRESQALDKTSKTDLSAPIPFDQVYSGLKGTGISTAPVAPASKSTAPVVPGSSPMMPQGQPQMMGQGPQPVVPQVQPQMMGQTPMMRQGPQPVVPQVQPQMMGQAPYPMMPQGQPQMMPQGSYPVAPQGVAPMMPQGQPQMMGQGPQPATPAPGLVMTSSALAPVPATNPVAAPTSMGPAPSPQFAAPSPQSAQVQLQQPPHLVSASSIAGNTATRHDLVKMDSGPSPPPSGQK